MCRADVHPETETALAALLDDMAARLAAQLGADRNGITIGPVDFGTPEEERKADAICRT